MGYREDYDVVVVGAGHNGLILQAYLARAGLSTLAVDRSGHVGGGLTTVEDPRAPGFRHNTHAFFLRGLSRTPWFRDLDLANWGLRVVQPELNLALVQENGATFRWFLDVRDTAASLAEFSPEDGATWARVAEEFSPVLDGVVEPLADCPPLPVGELRRLLSGSALGRHYLEIMAKSPRQYIEETFKHPWVRAMLLYLCIIREVDVNVPGQGALVPSLISSPVKAEIAVGGSRRVAQALASDVAAHGGHIMVDAEPRAITVVDGRATGIELHAGARIRANRCVVTTPRSSASRHTGTKRWGRSSVCMYRYVKHPGTRPPAWPMQASSAWASRTRRMSTGCTRTRIACPTR